MMSKGMSDGSNTLSAARMDAMQHAQLESDIKGQQEAAVAASSDAYGGPWMFSRRAFDGSSAKKTAMSLDIIKAIQQKSTVAISATPPHILSLHNKPDEPDTPPTKLNSSLTAVQKSLQGAALFPAMNELATPNHAKAF